MYFELVARLAQICMIWLFTLLVRHVISSSACSGKFFHVAFGCAVVYAHLFQ
jgi:hypothetical protein